MTAAGPAYPTTLTSPMVSLGGCLQEETSQDVFCISSTMWVPELLLKPCWLPSPVDAVPAQALIPPLFLGTNPSGQAVLGRQCRKGLSHQWWKAFRGSWQGFPVPVFALLPAVPAPTALHEPGWHRAKRDAGIRHCLLQMSC